MLIATACTRPEPAPTAAPAAETPTTQPPVQAAQEAPPAPEAPTTSPADAFPRMEDLVRQDDTLASLQARLGASVAIAEVLPGAEGESSPGWVLYPDQPSRRLEVFLDEQGVRPASIVVTATASDWVRGDGLRIGLDIAALADLNGRPFGFAGFGWDYGGTVVDWKGGAIAPDGNQPGFVRLCPPESSAPLAYDQYPTGEGEFSSDLAVLKEHPPTVCEFTLNVPPSP